jgi:hypothetical protein
MSAQQSDTVNFYLAELTLALQVLPLETRRDIHRGIAEELRGLDDESARARIYDFGDPKYIAAAALDEVGASRVSTLDETAVSTAVPVRQDKTWYTLTTVLALLLGGIVIPFVGWFGGVVLLWSSKTWQLRDKIVGTLVLPFGLVTSILVLVRYGVRSMTVVGSGPSGLIRDTEYYGTPLIWALAYIVAAAPLVASVYLLVRARLIKKH